MKERANAAIHASEMVAPLNEDPSLPLANRVGLIVEADSFARAEAMLALARCGAVLRCVSATSAVRLLRHEPFDFVVWGIASADVETLDHVRRARAAMPHVPCIALLEEADDASAVPGHASLFDLVLPKPIDPTLLARCVETSLFRAEKRTRS